MPGTRAPSRLLSAGAFTDLHTVVGATDEALARLEAATLAVSSIEGRIRSNKISATRALLRVEARRHDQNREVFAPSHRS